MNFRASQGAELEIQGRRHGSFIHQRGQSKNICIIDMVARVVFQNKSKTFSSLNNTH